MQESELRDLIARTLEGILDPCSMAAGAPAGLVSMGLVGPVDVTPALGSNKADVRVTLFVTEPGCMVSALFQITAKEKLEKIEEIASADVRVDHGHLWDPSQMTKEYRERLGKYRSCQTRHMQKANA
ncbi:hypothetical protein EN943_33015 [Mesorhizobium sp. M7A.F.Ca.US.006.01.1.1]|uniref:hypothetical protein n=1 Tax=Mesorhizobium sp. M7A.F.Ca.US.006.01.1.1 TaxID=2496707 RepID=UPI000FCB64A3|nr:hypothetical protein [Mesorhizobium sp. M7A.F.Ca.US.006.01.1.1]RUZ71657.1 hypothetical protein EN943_33015 [Mesorhizobium sp. M7A.F.Ca.US.006.01.1.1]